MAWAMRNGLTLGIGATSRIGFALWYAIPFGVFCLGDPEAGAFIYATYGGLRTGLMCVVFAIWTAHPRWDYGPWLLSRRAIATSLASLGMVGLGATLFFLVGLG